MISKAWMPKATGRIEFNVVGNIGLRGWVGFDSYATSIFINYPTVLTSKESDTFFLVFRARRHTLIIMVKINILTHKII